MSDGLPKAGLADELIPLLRARLKKGGEQPAVDASTAPAPAAAEAPPAPAEAPASEAPAAEAPAAEAPAARVPARHAAAVERLFAFADRIEPARQFEAPVRRVRIVSFELDGDEYGLPIERVHEILRVGSITRVPNAPAHVRGVTNVRGRLLPVIELSGMLGLAPVELTKDARVVAVELAGRLLGLLVDRATRVLALLEDEIEPAPEAAVDPECSYIAGVAKGDGRLVMLLDLERALGVSG